MSKYKDIKSTEKIGQNIRIKRLEKGYTQQDVCDMTGISINTISAIENGGETSISYILAIAQSLETHPQEFLNIEIRLTPPLNLSPKSKERVALTRKIRNLILNTSFFDTPKRVSAILDELKLDQSESSKCSVVLNNLKQDGLLAVSSTEGKVNLYVKIKK